MRRMPSVQGISDENQRYALCLSEMFPVLSCSHCKKVPSSILYYVLNCSHYFCGDCLSKGRRCLECEGHYEIPEGIRAHHTLKHGIQAYHELNLVVHGTEIPKEETSLIPSSTVPNDKSGKNVSNTSRNTTKSKPLSETPKSLSSHSTRDETSQCEVKKKEKESPSKKTPNSTKRKPQKSLLDESNPTTPGNFNKKSEENKNIKSETLLKSSVKKSKKSLLNESISTPENSKKKNADNTSKKNKKGETPLHVACCKGDLVKANALLESGADPNTQDNAGWTPLHECAQKGYFDIAHALINNGAAPSVPSSSDNITPLHDASCCGWKEIIVLLIRNGADKEALDIRGKTPRDVAATPEIASLIDQTLSEVTETQALNMSVSLEDDEDVVLHLMGDSKIMANDKKIIKEMNWRIEPKFGREVTHVVIPHFEKDSEGNFLLKDPPSQLYFEAVLLGKKIVTREWLNACIDSLTKEEDVLYQVQGTIAHPFNAPKNSFINSSKRLPLLFSGMHFNVHNSVPDKKNICDMLKRGNGVILSREPDPEFIPESEKKIPYHADPTGPLKTCSHYIIYLKGSKKEPELKYDMQHLKTLPLEWVYECIHHFSIIPPFK